VRAVAVQSATAVFARSAYGGTGAVAPQQVPAVIAGLRRTWEVAEQPAERNAIVVALRGLKDAKAIAAAEELEKTERPAK
jgi:hypothetical protein